MRPIVVAHVDSASHVPDVFGRPRELRPGDQLTVHLDNTIVYADRLV